MASTNAVSDTSGTWARKRDAVFWLIAFSASLALHGLLFWWHPGGIVEPPPEKVKMRVTRLDFRQLARPRPQPAVAPVLVPQPRPEPARRPITSRPAPKKVARPQPPAKSEPPPVAATMPALPAAPPAAAPPVPSPVVAKAVAPPPPAAAPVDAESRQRYLQELFGHIESRKRYPATARRRRLEGGVEVSFVLTGAGAIEDLRVAGGHPMLQEAAKKSLERSLPLPLPGDGVVLPLTIRFRMEFRLH